MSKKVFKVKFSGFRSFMRLHEPEEFKFSGAVELELGECFEVGVKGHLFNCRLLQSTDGLYLKTLVQYGGYAYPAETLEVQITN